jgi:hypothetical protein
MFNLIFRLFRWFWQLWGRLDEKTKRQIIETIIERFNELARAFYRQWKSKKKK